MSNLSPEEIRKKIDDEGLSGFSQSKLKGKPTPTHGEALIDKGVWYQAACSGLWYEKKDACGAVCAIRVDGVTTYIGEHDAEISRLQSELEKEREENERLKWDRDGFMSALDAKEHRIKQLESRNAELVEGLESSINVIIKENDDG